MIIRDEDDDNGEKSYLKVEMMSKIIDSDQNKN